MNLNQNELGRSMVEMLGVLAVIGVLSVGGITGYTYSINKHRANELLEEANRRATVISNQIVLHNKTLSLNEFTNNDFNYAVFDKNVYGENGVELWNATKDSKFSIKISHVEKEICKNLQDSAGGMIQDFKPTECEDNNTVILSYDNSLSTITNANNKVEADCSAYSGTSSNFTGGLAGLAADGTTSCNCPERQQWNSSEGYCEQECTSYTSQECSSGYYCSFEDSASCDNCSALGGGTCTEGVGTCKPIFDGTQVTTANDGFMGLLTGTRMNWWTASSWCIAHGMQMPSLSEFECSRNSSKAGGWDCSWARFKGRLATSNWWVADDPDCRARNLNTPNNSVDFDTPRNGHYYSTLCTDGQVQHKVLSQVGGSCTNTSDCVTGLFCNASNKCEMKLDDGSACSSSETCKSGHCGQNGEGTNVCFTSCTSYTTNECGQNSYCVFNYPLDCTDSGVGACMPIIDGSTLTEAEDGLDGLYFAEKMNWWTASSLCAAHNKHLASLSEMGCRREEGVQSCEDCCENWSRFYNGKLSGNSWWASDNNSCLAYNVTLNHNPRVDIDTQRTNKTYYSVVCK